MRARSVLRLASRCACAELWGRLGGCVCRQEPSAFASIFNQEPGATSVRNEAFNSSSFLAKKCRGEDAARVRSFVLKHNCYKRLSASNFFIFFQDEPALKVESNLGRTALSASHCLRKCTRNAVFAFAKGRLSSVHSSQRTK